MLTLFSVFIFYTAVRADGWSYIPTTPQKNEPFQIRYQAPGNCNQENAKIILPKGLVKLSEGKSNRDKSCLFLWTLTAREPGAFALSFEDNGISKPAITLEIIDPAQPKSAQKPENVNDTQAWVQSLKKFLVSYLDPNSKAFGGDEFFSLESCRPDTKEFAKLFLKMRAEYPWNYKFQKDCDLDGEVSYRMGTMIPVNLSVRNLAKISRIQASFIMNAEMLPGLRLKNSVTMSDGLAFTGDQVVARFSIDGYRVIGVDMANMGITNVENSVNLKITELNGAPVNLVENLNLDRIDIIQPKLR